MPTVAVTGATGFIGWHVARQFLEAGWHVRALVRPESLRPVPDGVERVTASLTTDDVVTRARDAVLMVHMAAVVGNQSDGAFARSNVQATREVARACSRLGIRLVHMSSLGATGPGDPVDPPNEDSATRPINRYGESKLESEQAVKQIDGLDWTILRPTLVYGPRDRLFLPIFKSARLGVFPVPGGRAAYNLIHVHDVAHGVWLAASTPKAARETFFLGGPGQFTAGELMKLLASVFDKPFRPIPIPRVALRLLAEIGSVASAAGVRVPLNRARFRELDAPGFVCRTDKAERQLGFVAHTRLADGLQATATWYRENGKL